MGSHDVRCNSLRGNGRECSCPGGPQQDYAELAAALVQLQRDLAVVQQERDETQVALEVVRFEAKELRSSLDGATAKVVEVVAQRNEARGEVLGLQRMLEEAQAASKAERRPLVRPSLRQARTATGHCPDCGLHPDACGNCLNSWCTHRKPRGGGHT